jgi:hypothetical protein
MEEINFNLENEYLKSIERMTHNKTVLIRNNIAIVTDFKNPDTIYALYIPIQL